MSSISHLGTRHPVLNAWTLGLGSEGRAEDERRSGASPPPRPPPARPPACRGAAYLPPRARPRTRRPPSAPPPAFPRRPPRSRDAAAGSGAGAGLGPGRVRRAERRPRGPMGAGGPPGPPNGRGRAANTAQWARPVRPAFFEALSFPRNHFAQRRQLTVRVPFRGLRWGSRGRRGTWGCPQEFPRGRGGVLAAKSRAGRVVGVRWRKSRRWQASGAVRGVGRRRPGQSWALGAEAEVGSWRSGLAGAGTGFRYHSQGSGTDDGCETAQVRAKVEILGSHDWDGGGPEVTAADGLWSLQSDPHLSECGQSSWSCVGDAS